MKELFREKDIARVYYFRDRLEEQGIPAFIRNAELPQFFEALCVTNDEDYEKAMDLIRANFQMNQQNAEIENSCGKCGESNPGNFEICWSCSSALDLDVNDNNRKPSTTYTQPLAPQNLQIKADADFMGDTKLEVILLLVVGLGCFFTGLMLNQMSGSMAFIFSLLGFISIFGAYLKFSRSSHKLGTYRSQQNEYSDHLQASRAALQTKIKELEALRERQLSFKSERADSRRQLLDAAIENRRLKLALVIESQYIIISRHKMAWIQYLVHRLSNDVHPHSEELETQLSEAFADLRAWTEQAPAEWKSASGKSIQATLDKVLAFHPALQERIEDRKVIAALSEEGDVIGAVIPEDIRETIEQTSFEAEWNALDMAEFVAADEDYLRINTELRLTRDGIRHNLSGETSLDLE